ncbi:hypothetical protein PORCAN_1906 [Porphyromonas crevioricanis JCM 13913]|nr:hypothetical protein PORCAN_1906 [Porphyromonas crevioricanis JCM 13913]
MKFACSYQTADQRDHPNRNSEHGCKPYEGNIAIRCSIENKANHRSRKDTYQGRCPSTQSVEEGYELWHLYHFDSLCHNSAYQSSHNQSWVDSPSTQYITMDDCKNNAYKHSECRDGIPHDGCFHSAHHGYTQKHSQREDCANDNDRCANHDCLSPFFFLLNIWSILCVMPKPPTTLIVANIMAMVPNNWETKRWLRINRATPVADRAPTIVTPERAFIPDMRGVCSRLGTVLMMK